MAPGGRSTIGLAVLGALLAPAAAHGQIRTDGTVGAAQTLAGPNFAIPASLGQQAGANLFHSFGQFSVPTGGSATFSGPSSVGNIISRVTGADASSINGRLGSSITGANLFLINPRGIVFGPNASLDLTGSFYASTANYLKFADGTRFDATATAPAVLSIAPPTAFGFLGPTGTISVQGTALDRAPGRALALVGGGIEVRDAFLRTSAADLRLESIRTGEAAVSAAAAPAAGTTFGNVAIDASQVRAINSGALAPGRLLIRGGEIVVTDSLVRSANGGATDAPKLELSAAGDLRVSGSFIYANTQGAGRGADLLLTGENVTIDRAADVESWSSSIPGTTGRAGDLEVSARRALRIIAAPGDPAYTTFFNIAFGAGAGGATRLSGDTVTIEAASIENYTQRSADAGPLFLRGRVIEILNGGLLGNWSATGATGRGSSIDIDATERVRIAGADWTGYRTNILASTGGSQDAGAIRISAPEIEVAGARIQSLADFSNIGASGSITLAGSKRVAVTDGSLVFNSNWNSRRGGDLRIEAGDLVVSGGADIEINNYGTGRAGDLVVNVTGRADLDRGFIQNLAVAAGDAGRLEIRAPVLSLTNRARVESTTLADGAGGALEIHAGRVSIAGGSTIVANSGRFVSGVLRAGRGDGGRITLDATEEVSITGAGSAISATTLGAGRAGTIEVHTPRLTLADRGFVAAGTAGSGPAGSILLDVGELSLGSLTSVFTGNSFVGWPIGTGDSGEIVVRASGSVRLADGAIIGSNTWSTGHGGRVAVESSGAVSMAGANTGIFAGTFSAGNGGDVEVKTPHLVISDDAQIGANTGGSGRAGNIALDVGDLEVTSRGAITSGNSLLSGTIGTGDAGEIRIRASGHTLVTGGAYIETSTWSTGRGGQVTVDSGELTIRDGGLINAATVGTGDGGAVTVRTGALRISDDTSGIFATTFGPGRGGRVQVTTPHLLISNDGQIGANTGGSGHAGSIIVDVGDLELRGRGGITSGNRLATGPIGTGDGGEIQVHASGDVLLAEGSTIGTNTFSTGRGGRITVEARELTLAGESGIAANSFGGGDGGAITVRGDALRMSNFSRITAGTFVDIAPGSGDGNAGSVNVDVGRLELTGGAQIISSSGTGDETHVIAGRGAAGDVSVVARDSMLLSGEGKYGASGLYSQTYGAGRGGRIVATTPQLVMEGGAAIDTSTAGAGDAGAIDLRVGNAVVRGAGTGINSGNFVFFRGSRFDGTGAGGLIRIGAAGSLVLDDGAIISTRTANNAAAGNVSIDAAAVDLRGRSLITSQSFAGGNAGSVSINAGAALRVFDGSSITTAAERSDGGNIDIRAADIVHLRSSEITTSVGSGQGAGGNIFIDPTFVILENSRIVANAFGGPGGNIRIIADYFLSSPGSIVDASSRLGVSGSVQIAALNTNLSNELAALPAQVLDASAMLRDSCTTRFASRGGSSSLVGVGRGGLAASPERFAPSTYLDTAATSAMSDGELSPTGLRLRTAQRVRLIVACAA